jgi:branched-chain amino acid transport system permease protein
MDLRELFVIVITGIPVGVTYALIGYAFSLLYRSCGAFNFAAGQLAILGALVYITLSASLPVSFSLVVAVLVSALLGVALYFGVVRWVDIRGATPATLLILMLGVSIVIENAAPSIWGYYALAAPPLIDGGMNMGGTFIPYQRIVLPVVAAIALGLVFFFERRTMLGKALVATGADREAAILSGVNDRLVQGIAWAVAFGITALAGILFTPLASAKISSAVRYSVYGISAAFVGGLGSAEGALLGGLALGILSLLVATFISTQFADAILFVLVIAFLLWRPAGLFGNARRLKGPRA